jgi:uncharacterized protein
LAVTPTVVKGRLHKARQQLRVQLANEIDRSFSRNYRKDTPKMVQVTVSDVVQKNLDASPTHPHRAVLLLDSAGQRVLPIWVGQFEGDAIAVALRNVSFGRPLTYNFMANVLKGMGAKLQEVQVSALRDETFFATVKIEVNGKVQETDARPSDAIALALTMGSPLYVAEEVMATALPVNSEKVAELKSGGGIDAIVEKIEAERAAVFAKRDELHAALHKAETELTAVSELRP